VFGTESLIDPAALDAAARAGFDPILSLDHRAGRMIVHPDAPPSSLPSSTPSRWPRRVIAMTLDQVGAYEGPDLATFNAIRAKAGERAVIGAGGIRHAADLAAAAASGAPAWLVASALHDGRLDLGAGERRSR
jgi:phosphoribosylformimino-5-aminoimidazole carboxamide ribotide isomerase